MNLICPPFYLNMILAFYNTLEYRKFAQRRQSWLTEPLLITLWIYPILCLKFLELCNFHMNFKGRFSKKIERSVRLVSFWEWVLSHFKFKRDFLVNIPYGYLWRNTILLLLYAYKGALLKFHSKSCISEYAWESAAWICPPSFMLIK